MVPRSSKPLFLYSPQSARASRVSGTRWVVLALVVLAVSSPWHQRPFLTRPDLSLASSSQRQSAPAKTRARRLDSTWRAASPIQARFQAGDVVEITDEVTEGWHEATVDYWDSGGSLKVHFCHEDYDYHCVPSSWRVPKKTPKQNAGAELPKLKAADLRVGQKLRGKVVTVVADGIRVDVGAEKLAFVFMNTLPSTFNSDALGQEVDVWYVRENTQSLVCLMQDFSSTVDLVGQNFPIEVTSRDGDGFAFVRAELPNGFLHGLLEPTDAEVGSKFEAKLVHVYPKKFHLTFRPVAAPEDIAAFDGVSDGQWLPAIVAATYTRYVAVRVWPPGDGSTARTGFIEAADVTEDFWESTTEGVEVGKAVSVRIVRSDMDEGLLRFTMNAKVDLSVFHDWPASEWLNATIYNIAQLRTWLKVTPPGGGKPVRGYMSREIVDEAGAEVGLQIRVRVKRVNEQAQTLDVTASDYLYFADLPRDQWIEGTVKNTLIFGALVTIAPPGGTLPVTGLLHRSNLKGSVEDVRKVFQKGEAVRVRVKDVEVEAERLTLTNLEPETL